MKAVILAGGLGTRLRPLTHIIPKPLLPVGERSVLEISINKLKDCGFDEIFIATNYKSYMFENYFGNGSKFNVKITYSKEITIKNGLISRQNIDKWNKSLKKLNTLYKDQIVLIK